MNEFGALKTALRSRFATLWEEGCATYFGRALPLIAEGDVVERDIQHDAYAELWFVMSDRERTNGGNFAPEHRTLGRLQLTVYLRRGAGTELVDKIYDKIWRPMFEAPADRFEGVFFEPANPPHLIQLGEVWAQYVTDSPFRWDEL